MGHEIESLLRDKAVRERQLEQGEEACRAGEEQRRSWKRRNRLVRSLRRSIERNGRSF